MSNETARWRGQARIDEVDLMPYLQPPPLVVVISGTSGAGKDVTIRRLKELGYPFRFVVTATTRERRPGEVHGVDYYFVSPVEFERMIERGELIEYALVYGQYKGIPKAEVRQALDSGRDVIMRVDVQGAARVRQIMPEAVFIFLTASSEQELADRLRARQTETPEALAQRLATARAEMQEIHHFDYVIINRDGELDCTVERIISIIKAEKCRARPRVVKL